MFLAILNASFSSPKILIIVFKSNSLKLFTASKAEILFRPMHIFKFLSDLNENPLLRSSNCIEDKPKSKITVST